MIDSNVISLINIKDSFQVLEIYSNKVFYNLYAFFYIINQHQINNIIIEFIFKILFFLQFIFIVITWMPEKRIFSDFILKLLFSLKNIFFFHDIISNNTKYIIALIISFIYNIIIILLIFIILKQKKPILIQIYNYVNLIFINYFLIFQINTVLCITLCKNSKTKYLEFDCYKIKHIILIIICLIFLIFSIFYFFIVNQFLGTIGNMKNMNIYSRINSYYNIYSNTLTIIYHFLGFYNNIYGENRLWVRIIVRVIFLIFSLFILIYFVKNSYFYNESMNFINLMGWSFTMWFTVTLLLRNIFPLKQIYLFLIIGWFFLGLFIYFYLKNKREKSLTNINIIHNYSLKEIEIFNHNIYLLLEKKNDENTILLTGIINLFKENFYNDINLKEIYEKFSTNQYLIQKLCDGKYNYLFEVNGIIFTLLNSALDRNKNDSIFILCAFLINQIKNYNLAMYYCSKYKLKGIYNNYLKYSLIEDSKFLILKKLKESNLDELNKIQIGKVILYYKLIDNLKIKIHDTALEQYDYFDILRNNNIDKSLIPDLIKSGKKILKNRKEIFTLWNKIISLNVFNEDIKKDYMFFLCNIIQDNNLYKEEEIKFLKLNNLKLIYKDRIYYSLFDENISSIILINGYSIKGKIIYTTSNFGNLFHYTPKDILNLEIHNLVPKCISYFHNELYNESLKYSNIRKIFKKEKDILLKGKNNELYHIKGFFKLIPDFSIGSIYIGLLQKIRDKDFIILLNNVLKIDSMSIPFYSNYLNNNIYNKEKYPFGINDQIIGFNISIIIPNILNLIRFNNDKMIINKVNTDFKGILYPNINDISNFEKKINSYIDYIKEKRNKKSRLGKKFSIPKNLNNNIIINENENKNYLDLIDDYNKNCNNIFYKISYNITNHVFLNNKYMYYRVYINSDIFSEFEIQENYKILKTINNSINFDTFNDKYNHDNQSNKIQLLINDESKNNNKTKENEKNTKSNNQNILIEKTYLKNNKNSNNSKLRNYYINFQDLKQKILKNEMPYLIILMEIISLSFPLLTIILIIFTNHSVKYHFKEIERYLKQSYIFIYVKIIVFAIYFSIIDLKMLKYNIIGNQTCVNKYFCLENFDKLIDMEIRNLKENLDQIFELDIELQNKFTKNYSINIYSSNPNNNFIFNTQLTDILSLIFSTTKIIDVNIENYILYDNKYFNSYIKSILEYCYLYLNLNDTKGLDNSQKRENIKQERFLYNKNYFYINSIFFIIILVFFIKFALKIQQTQSNLIIKIVKFNTESFEKYIKFLEELKKQLKREINDENKSNEENTNYKELDEEKIEQKAENEKKKNKKENKKKKLKIPKSNFKQQKINIMIKYFFIYNIGFLIKIMSISILLLFYYLIIYIYNENRTNNLLKFDHFMSSVFEVYISTFSSFEIIKTQSINFTDFIIDKNEKINQLNSNYELVSFNNEIYTKENLTLLQNQKYYFEIPNEEQISVKKLNEIISLFSIDIDMTKNNSYSLLIKLFHGNACDVLFHLFFHNEPKYNICVEFWSNFVTKGLENCFIQLEIEFYNIIDKFKYINNNNVQNINNLKDFENLYSNCDDFILNYLYLSYRETQFIFRDLEKDKTDIIYKSIEEFVIFFILGDILSFFLFLILIYFNYIQFKGFINFIIIFPFEYLIEEENLYIEIIKLHKLLF